MSLAETRIVLGPHVPSEGLQMQMHLTQAICDTLETILDVVGRIRLSRFHIAALRLADLTQVKDIIENPTSGIQHMQISSFGEFHAITKPRLHVVDVKKQIRGSSPDLVGYPVLATDITLGQRLSSRLTTKQVELHLSSVERKAVAALLVRLKYLATLLPDNDIVDPVLTDELNPSPADDHLINSLRRSRQKMRPADDQLINSLRRSRQKMQPADEDVDLLVSFEECTRSPDPIQLHVADWENLLHTALLLRGTDLSTRCDIVSTEEGDLPTYHSWNAELSSTASPLRSLVSRNESDPQLVSFPCRCQPKVQSPDEYVAPLVVKPTPTRSTVLLPVEDTD
ncbi:MAG: uncharacterized protein KVP18_002647, partial [Porospora cf. gigantea A]|uniref:uncharacterized protein n=1 Tax=Porospora cf. gigantea A TaxID=2853593 RepID=UPI003559517C